ncbi:MAG: VacJ family lipoprotein [Alphaproteobacteria bacterium]|nr:VacJ family lipoprotein [Alphaproteobacteria bacterium]MDE2336053.1 VacJ family lipoprotein [Alphaproteobacteria bacterium]
MPKAASAALLLTLVLAAGGCAKAQKPPVTTAYRSQQIADPIEPVNRFVFGFNDILDRALIEPLAKGYNAVLPQCVRDAVQNFMRNLKSPIIVANDLLQGQVSNAGVATARFVINSTVGIAGLVDVASTKGMKYQDEDFGQTLAAWGVGNGFYLVLPVIGPSTLRDATGTFADAYADPVRLWAYNTDNDWVYYAREGLQGLDERSRLIKPIDDMRRNSLDYYAAARSAYLQHRDAVIRANNPSAAPAAQGGADQGLGSDHP